MLSGVVTQWEGCKTHRWQKRNGDVYQVQYGDYTAARNGSDRWTEVKVQRPQCETGTRPLGGVPIMSKGWGFARDDGNSNAKNQER